MILGGRINKAEAKRLKDGAVKGLAVNIDVKELREDGETLVVSYEYTVSYQPEVAEIKIAGEVVASEDAASRKKLVEEWKKNKTMLPSFAEDVLTAINYAGTATGTLLSFSVGIGAPLNIPRARVQEAPKDAKKQTKAG
ncbi:MAG: hypothetical protein WC607_00035 [Candidatus Micrarchaeia archaeon]